MTFLILIFDIRYSIFDILRIFNRLKKLIISQYRPYYISNN